MSHFGVFYLYLSNYVMVLWASSIWLNILKGNFQQNEYLIILLAFAAGIALGVIKFLESQHESSHVEDIPCRLVLMIFLLTFSNLFMGISAGSAWAFIIETFNELGLSAVNSPREMHELICFAFVSLVMFALGYITDKHSDSVVSSLHSGLLILVQIGLIIISELGRISFRSMGNRFLQTAAWILEVVSVTVVSFAMYYQLNGSDYKIPWILFLAAIPTLFSILLNFSHHPTEGRKKFIALFCCVRYINYVFVTLSSSVILVILDYLTDSGKSWNGFLYLLDDANFVYIFSVSLALLVIARFFENSFLEIELRYKIKT
ncbi:hypothetical protein [Rothia nasimurium]|uniref:hypothetical protein n=1 Tax=Rothia nasimurium TaxID=85336 RepID=UPI001F35B2B5|nr:hypothetical protein [Rothia nasimurium]